MNLRPNLFIPPIYRSQNAPNRRVTWLELFYDIIFVVVVSQLTNTLSGNFTWGGVGRFALLCLPCWWAWMGQTIYLSRFDTDDLTHQIATMIKMFIVVVLALAIPHAFGEHRQQFAYAYGALRLILVFEYWRAGAHNSHTRPLTTRYFLGFLLAAVLWIWSTRFEPEIQIYIWILAIFVDYMTPLAAGAWNMLIPAHVRHLPERLGLFTLIIIGESIVAVVLALDRSGFTPLSVVASLAAWISSFCVWYMYFNGIHGAEERTVEDEESTRAYRTWMYTHLVLMIGLIASASAMKGAIMGATGVLSATKAVTLCMSAGITMTCMLVIFLSNPSVICDDAMRNYIRPPAQLTLVPFLLAPISPFLNATFLAVTICICWIGQFVLTLRAGASPEIDASGGFAGMEEIVEELPPDNAGV